MLVDSTKLVKLELVISVLHFYTDNNWVIILPSDFFLFFTNPNSLYKTNTARYFKFGL